MAYAYRGTTRDGAGPSSLSLDDVVTGYVPIPSEHGNTESVTINLANTPSPSRSRSSSSSSRTSSPIVKAEPEDAFIHESLPTPLDPSTGLTSQDLAPPTEVPLRATHATPEMRGMMGVFRLDPFAMHENGGRGVLPTWAGGVARPHEQDGEFIEWKITLLYPLIPPELQDIWTLSPKTESDRSLTPTWEYQDCEGYHEGEATDASMLSSPIEVFTPPGHLQGPPNMYSSSTYTRGSYTVQYPASSPDVPCLPSTSSWAMHQAMQQRCGVQYPAPYVASRAYASNSFSDLDSTAPQSSTEPHASQSRRWSAPSNVAMHQGAGFYPSYQQS